MNKISIVTATLNRPSLRFACESVDNQFFTDWYHYVLGDGILPIDYVHKNRSTLGFSRIMGNEEPSADKPYGTPNPILRWAIEHLELGEFICILDDDNTYKPNFLMLMYETLINSPAGIVICALEDHRKDNIHDGYPELGRCDMSAFLVYTKIAKEIGFPWVTPGEDNIEDFRFIKMCSERYGWVRVPEMLVDFGSSPPILPDRPSPIKP